MDDKTLIQTHTLTVEEASKHPNFFLLPKPRQGYYFVWDFAVEVVALKVDIPQKSEITYLRCYQPP